MDGFGIYYPCSTIWMAYSQGIELSFGQLASIAVLSTLGAIGASPIPNSGIAFVLLIAEQVSVPTDGYFPLVVAVDIILDRVITGMSLPAQSPTQHVLDLPTLANSNILISDIAVNTTSDIYGSLIATRLVSKYVSTDDLEGTTGPV